MPFLSLTGRRRALLKGLTLPGIALVLAVLYVIALHPASGYLGGAFYFLIGSWFIPSAINLIVSAWIVSLIDIARAWRVVLFVIVSFLLGMNTLLPGMIKVAPAPVSSSEILRVIHLSPTTAVDEGLMTPALPGDVYQTSAPSALGIQVGGNEGCMCMWFTPPVGESTDWQVWHVINAYLHRRDSIDSTDYLDAGMRRMASGGVHFAVAFAPGTMRDTVDVRMTLYDGLEPTATFRQAGIPVWSTSKPEPHGSGLGGERFYPNALSMLLRHNFWVFYLDSWMSGFSPGPLKAFLHRAVIVE